MPEARDPTTARTGPRQVSLRTAVGTLLQFLAFAAVARVYLVSDTPQQPGWWLLGSATCAGASWWLLRARTATVQQRPTH